MPSSSNDSSAFQRSPRGSHLPYGLTHPGSLWQHPHTSASKYFSLNIQLRLLWKVPFGSSYFIRLYLDRSFLSVLWTIILRWFFYFWSFQRTMKKKLSATKPANMHFPEQQHLEQILGNHIRQKPVPTVFETWNWKQGKNKFQIKHKTTLHNYQIGTSSHTFVYPQISPHLVRHILRTLLTFPPPFQNKDQRKVIWMDTFRFLCNTDLDTALQNPSRYFSTQQSKHYFSPLKQP